MLNEMIKDCEVELKALEQARGALRTVAHTSYANGAPLDFLDSLELTISLLSGRIANVNKIKAQCYRKLEGTERVA